ncbi:MAG: PDZ domain-containing protein [Xanthomonadales bacterium]|nr:PDZ domain-containing protein [Xanthomonadales bacterium]
MIRAAFVICSILLAWLPRVAAAADAAAPDPAAAPVRHELSFPQRHNQYVHVRATWPAGDEPLELVMPAWTPGSYLIRDFSAHVEHLRARTPGGRVLEARKVAKNRWRIAPAGASEVTVDYDVWAGELNVATSWVEADLAVLNGASLFLFSDASRDGPQQVAVVLPEGWSGVHTPLRATAQPGVYHAADYDELVDSPIVAGSLSRHEFKVRGQPYALVLGAGDRWWDAAKAQEDLARIVEAQQEFWGVNPFDREYLFINLFMGPFGGLEHDHGTVMMVDPWQMLHRADYVKWLGLVSHEFFHAWNVRRMRPQALARYDYGQEVYTQELWLAEGLSSYYDDLLLFRAGLIDVADYFDLLAQEIRNYETMPGRHVRSAEWASFDTWIKQYKPDENSVNSTVSYYRKGALIGFVTDTAIRRETRNSKSLDTVMRELYGRYGPDGPGQGAYPPGAFEEAVERIAGPAVRRYVEDLLRATDDPDVDAALDWYGLILNRAPARTAAENAGAPVPAGFGVAWDASGPRLLAEQVILGHAGADAGMLPGDELLAIDGIRVGPVDHVARMQRLVPGQVVELTLARHERLLTLRVEVREEIEERYLILTKPKVSQAEKDRLSTWLGRELRFLR